MDAMRIKESLLTVQSATSCGHVRDPGEMGKRTALGEYDAFARDWHSGWG
jgi:hypothetical protein